MLRREEPGAGAGSHPARAAAVERARGNDAHDYKRNGTTTLFVALNVLDGQVIGQYQQRHTHAEWLKFLKKIDRETPKDKTLHLIADKRHTQPPPAVQDWLAKHPRVNTHFTPTSASWLNMVERFFRDITTERLRRAPIQIVIPVEAGVQVLDSLDSGLRRNDLLI